MSLTTAHGPNKFLVEDSQAEHGTVSHQDESNNPSVPPEVALNNSAPSFSLTVENIGNGKFPSYHSCALTLSPLSMQ